MRIISKGSLKHFYQRPEYQDSQASLEAWHAEARQANWSSPADIKEYYRSDSILHDNRVVFNIAGNKYRLVVKIHYNTGIVYIRFVGTHAQYDKIDAERI